MKTWVVYIGTAPAARSYVVSAKHSVGAVMAACKLARRDGIEPVHAAPYLLKVGIDA